MDDGEALNIAASIERMSEHSLAKAIVNGNINGNYKVSGFRAIPGMGAKGRINSKLALIGNRTFTESADNISWTGFDKDQNDKGDSTAVYLAYDNKPAGIFYISDRIRPEANDAVSELRVRGYDVFLITGDRQTTADSVAETAGIDADKVMARVSPVEKSEAIQKLQKEGRRVMMVGDGINDAPALVQADVGVAMGRATDIALESADMVLMRSDLKMVPAALSIAKKIYSIIRQNLFWAFFYNIIALPLAMAGILHPIFAAIAMTFSSLSVVGNSMRLRWA
jgi:P-type E1-E2 ATPase